MQMSKSPIISGYVRYAQSEQIGKSNNLSACRGKKTKGPSRIAKSGLGHCTLYLMKENLNT
jgi:hypothetical protein